MSEKDPRSADSTGSDANAPESTPGKTVYGTNVEGDYVQGDKVDVGRDYIAGDAIGGDKIEGDYISGDQNVVGDRNIVTYVGTLVQKSVDLKWPLILLGLILVAVIVIIWQQRATTGLLRGPETMDGTFNIAVADFGILGTDGTVRASEFGAAMRSTVVDQLTLEYESSDLLRRMGGDLQVWDDSMPSAEKGVTLGTIEGSTVEERAASAEALAAKINADMLIYGYLREADDPNSLMLEFYYSSDRLRGEPDAIVGTQRLGAPIAVRVDVEDDLTQAKALAALPLGTRSRLLAWLTTGLTLDVVGAEELALQLFQEAGEQFTTLSNTDGRAVLDYFIGRQAFLLRQHDVAEQSLNDALATAPDYANAHITLGSVFYDRAQLFFVRDGDLPEGLEQCVALEQITSGPASLDEALADIDSAKSYFAEAITLSEESVYPALADIALLMRGQNSRLEGQALLFETGSTPDSLVPRTDPTQAKVALKSAEIDLNEALSRFESQDQVQLGAMALAALGATKQLQAYVALLEGDPDAGLALNEQALDYFSTCVDQGEAAPADLFLQERVIECGCLPYRDALQTQLQLEGTE